MCVEVFARETEEKDSETHKERDKQQTRDIHECVRVGKTEKPNAYTHVHAVIQAQSHTHYLIKEFTTVFEEKSAAVRPYFIPFLKEKHTAHIYNLLLLSQLLLL